MPCFFLPRRRGDIGDVIRTGDDAKPTQPAYQQQQTTPEQAASIPCNAQLALYVGTRGATAVPREKAPAVVDALDASPATHTQPAVQPEAAWQEQDSNCHTHKPDNSTACNDRLAHCSVKRLAADECSTDAKLALAARPMGLHQAQGVGSGRCLTGVSSSPCTHGAAHSGGDVVAGRDSAPVPVLQRMASTWCSCAGGGGPHAGIMPISTTPRSTPRSNSSGKASGSGRRLPSLPRLLSSTATAAAAPASGSSSRAFVDDPALVAWRGGRLGLCFSGAGFLFPYFLGVLQARQLLLRLI